MRRWINWMPLLLAVGLPAAFAARPEDAMLAQLRKAHPGTRFDRVAPTPVAGIYEVWMGDNVAYASRGSTRYLIFGHLFDVRHMRDLTASRQAGRPSSGGEPLQEATGTIDRQAVADVPVADAIVATQGNGARRLLVFTDPACRFCRQLDKEMRGLRDVTVLHYLVPFLGRALPEAIWCAPDRDVAYRQVMADGSAPQSPVAACATPLERNRALASRFGIRATPTLVFADGRIAAGVLSADDIEAGLARAAGGPTKTDGLAWSNHANSRER
jgi:thiol:disulfide interchange protein DsbC